MELARDLAIRFNRTYGRTFVVPELQRATTAGRVRDLLTPTAKMSKSDPDEAGRCCASSTAQMCCAAR